MGMDYTNGQMDRYMMENGMKGKYQDLEFIGITMGECMKEAGSTI